jgi:hypothetical protein
MKKKLLVATVLFLSSILFISGCESLKPNSISVGYAPPYYEDTAMWRGFRVGARWDL